MRTSLMGHRISFADIVIISMLRKGEMEWQEAANVARWLRWVESTTQISWDTIRKVELKNLAKRNETKQRLTSSFELIQAVHASDY